ncbi:MAG: hypothetical protein J6V44_08305 [Methanobrevibacter sp.]|nr:hypothetical protein [Methanobrevibacter sp.]
MAWFKIFAGMSGSFGGAQYHGTYEYIDEDEAMADAYLKAEEEYQSYEGCHGIMSPSDVEEDLRDSGFIDDDMTDDEVADMVDCYYREEIESWISYYVQPATGPNDTSHDD